MEKIRFGIIGLGNQGCNYLFKLFENENVENGVVTAVCDKNESKIQNVKEKSTTENLAYFYDYKEMLDSGLCEAVLVETPHYQHPEIVKECLKRNIHVICDKPAGVYTKQVREMNEIAQKSKAHFSMMFNQRTNCIYRKMKEMIANGELGRLQRINWVITNWFRTQMYYDSGSWRATWAGEGGGVLINQCPHQIDLVQWIVGKLPSRVHGFCKYGQWHNIEVEDEVTAFFEYDDGATGIFITTTGEAPGVNRLEISGTKGMLVAENEQLIFYKNKEDSMDFAKTSMKPFARPECEKIIVETDGEDPQHKGIINNFANALLGLEEFFVDGKEGINGVELMNAIELSGWRGGAPVSIPVDEEEYLKELNIRKTSSRHKEVDDSLVVSTDGTFKGTVIK